MSKLNLFFTVAAVALSLTLAITEDEKNAIKAAILPVVEKCTEEFGITKEDLIAAKKAGDLESFDPCLHACFFKKIGFINEAGLFDPDVALEKNKQYIKDEDDLNNLAAIGKACSAVNEQAVSDGDKGCERSKLLFTCFIKEKGSKFSPFAAE